jgi:hypothetical protein
MMVHTHRHRRCTKEPFRPRRRAETSATVAQSVRVACFTGKFFISQTGSGGAGLRAGGGVSAGRDREITD